MTVLQKGSSWWREHKEYLKKILSLTWPNVLTFLIQFALPTTSTYAVGHLGDPLYIGASALGNMFANATGFAVGSGLSMALDTLCSQAYGAKKYYLVGLYCQRAMAILTIACVPIALIWWNGYAILALIGTEQVAQLSLDWMKRLTPSIWPRIMYEAYRRYLLAQRIMWPITVSVAAVVPFHIMNTYLLVYKFKWGYTGAAWATSMSYWLLFVVLIVTSYIRIRYLRRKGTGHVMLKESEEMEMETLDGADEKGVPDEGDPLHTWPPLSTDIFRGWISYLKLGVATSASLVIEWGSFEVNAAIASRLGEVSLATHAIVVQVAGIWYCTAIAVATAASTLVGNSLGSGEPEKAKIYTKLAFILAAIYGLANGAIGMLYSDILGYVFTNVDEVSQFVTAMVPVLWIYGFVDSIKAVGMAVLRGCGKPTYTVFGNVLSCLIVGYPVALLLVFKGNYGLQGLWMGMSTAWLSASILYITLIVRTDWSVEVKKAAQRNVDALNSMKNSGAIQNNKETLKVVITQEEGESFSIGDEGDEKESFLESAKASDLES